MSVKLLTNILYDAIIVIIILIIVIYIILPLFFQDSDLVRLKKSLNAVCKEDNAFRDFRLLLEKYDLLFNKSPNGYKAHILLCKGYKINNSIRYREICETIYEIDCRVDKVILNSKNVKIKDFVQEGVCYDVIHIPNTYIFITYEFPKYVSSDNSFSQRDSFALGDYCYLDYCKYDECGKDDDTLTKEIVGALMKHDNTLYIEINAAR